VATSATRRTAARDAAPAPHTGVDTTDDITTRFDEENDR
jgi:hypothetical protein